ncbi:MAG: NAD(P)H-binding protein [Myxococcaceae bacterium]
MNARKLFVAGSTGATGKILVAQAQQRRLPFVAHVRPKHLGTPGLPSGSVGFELKDGAALDRAMRGCTTVLQLIGTLRKRFGQGDTYESSDIGTTRLLVEAARRNGADHFILLSSVGAGRPMGAYLKAKAEAERLVRESGLPYTIFRPSALEGPGRTPPPGLEGLTKVLRLHTLRPISLKDLSRAMLNCAKARQPLETVLEGAPLFKWVGL